MSSQQQKKLVLAENEDETLQVEKYPRYPEVEPYIKTSTINPDYILFLGLNRFYITKALGHLGMEGS